MKVKTHLTIGCFEWMSSGAAGSPAPTQARVRSAEAPGRSPTRMEPAVGRDCPLSLIRRLLRR